MSGSSPLLPQSGAFESIRVSFVFNSEVPLWGSAGNGIQEHKLSLDYCPKLNKSNRLVVKSR